MTIPVRLHRSELCVPGTSERMLEKAPSLGADIVMLDLEDAVAPDDKPRARENVIAALRELDWSGCTVTLRINGLDTTTATGTSSTSSSRAAGGWTWS